MTAGRKQEQRIRTLEMSMRRILGIGVLGFALLGSVEGAELPRARPSQSPVKPSELPTHLKWVREHPTWRPPPEIRREARPEDKGWLMREYRFQNTPRRRHASGWLLAYIGDDDVFRLFSDALRLGPGSRTPDASEYGMFSELLRGMGLMAQTNDLAFQFLKDAINMDWWRKERKWTSIWKDPRKEFFLASSAVQALGLSGRAEAGAIFDRMRHEGFNYQSPRDARDGRELNWAVYKAKQYLEASRKMGQQASRDGLFGEEFMRHMREWRRSEEGLEWFEWCSPKIRSPDNRAHLDETLKLMDYYDF